MRISGYTPGSGFSHHGGKNSGFFVKTGFSPPVDIGGNRKTQPSGYIPDGTPSLMGKSVSASVRVGCQYGLNCPVGYGSHPQNFNLEAFGKTALNSLLRDRGNRRSIPTPISIGR